VRDRNLKVTVVHSDMEEVRNTTTEILSDNCSELTTFHFGFSDNSHAPHRTDGGRAAS